MSRRQAEGEPERELSSRSREGHLETPGGRQGPNSDVLRVVRTMNFRGSPNTSRTAPPQAPTSSGSNLDQPSEGAEEGRASSGARGGGTADEGAAGAEIPFGETTRRLARYLRPFVPKIKVIDSAEGRYNDNQLSLYMLSTMYEPEVVHSATATNVRPSMLRTMITSDGADMKKKLMALYPWTPEKMFLGKSQTKAIQNWKLFTVLLAGATGVALLENGEGNKLGLIIDLSLFFVTFFLTGTKQRLDEDLSRWTPQESSRLYLLVFLFVFNANNYILVKTNTPKPEIVITGVAFELTALMGIGKFKQRTFEVTSLVFLCCATRLMLATFDDDLFDQTRLNASTLIVALWIIVMQVDCNVGLTFVQLEFFSWVLISLSMVILLSLYLRLYISDEDRNLWNNLQYIEWRFYVFTLPSVFYPSLLQILGWGQSGISEAVKNFTLGRTSVDNRGNLRISRVLNDAPAYKDTWDPLNRLHDSRRPGSPTVEQAREFVTRLPNSPLLRATQSFSSLSESLLGPPAQIRTKTVQKLAVTLFHLERAIQSGALYYVGIVNILLFDLIDASLHDQLFLSDGLIRSALNLKPLHIGGIPHNWFVYDYKSLSYWLPLSNVILIFALNFVPIFQEHRVVSDFLLLLPPVCWIFAISSHLLRWKWRHPRPPELLESNTSGTNAPSTDEIGGIGATGSTQGATGSIGANVDDSATEDVENDDDDQNDEEVQKVTAGAGDSSESTATANQDDNVTERDDWSLANATDTMEKLDTRAIDTGFFASCCPASHFAMWVSFTKVILLLQDETSIWDHSVIYYFIFACLNFANTLSLATCVRLRIVARSQMLKMIIGPMIIESMASLLLSTEFVARLRMRQPLRRHESFDISALTFYILVTVVMIGGYLMYVSTANDLQVYYSSLCRTPVAMLALLVTGLTSHSYILMVEFAPRIILVWVFQFALSSTLLGVIWFIRV